MEQTWIGNFQLEFGSLAHPLELDQASFDGEPTHGEMWFWDLRVGRISARSDVGSNVAAMHAKSNVVPSIVFRTLRD
jgi:hypothetical protein